MITKKLFINGIRILLKLIKIMKDIKNEKGRKDIKFYLAIYIFNPILRKLGYTLITDHFYQPIPNKNELLLYKNKPRPLDAINWNIDRQIEFTDSLLKQYNNEFNDSEYISSCGYIERLSRVQSGDAEFLYAMVRYLKPKTIIEVGAGGSTQISLAALKQNYNETKTKSKMYSIDPYPSNMVIKTIKGVSSFVEFKLFTQEIQQFGLKFFTKLTNGDILFIDSSHVFKAGSDVEYEFLQIYPKLNEDVYIHIHDIFFPYDYPYDWNEKRNRFWNEQYHLETFLMFNKKYEIITSLSVVNDAQKEMFLKNIIVFQEGHCPGSFWMKTIK